MNPFKREDQPFIVDVTQHAGNYLGIVDGLNYWEIRDSQQEPFKAILEKASKKVSGCHKIPRSTLLLLDIFLRGRTLDFSAACVMLGCSTEQYRKKAIKHLKRSSLLRLYPGLEVDHWDCPPITMPGKGGGASEKNLLYRCPKFDIRRLALGNTEDTGDVLHGSLLSIIATNDEATPRAGVLSFIVMVEKDDFFVAPAHIFMPRPPEEPEEDVEDSESDNGSEILRAGSATPPDLCSNSAKSEDSEGTTDDIVQKGSSDSWGKLGGDAERPYSTQPFPATEGFEIFSPEHDYALIPVPQGETFHQVLCRISPEMVKRIDAGQFAVSVMTPSCGLMNGRLDGRSTLMRLPYSSKFTRFYPIRFPDAISEGDCGSLVIDQNTKQIYGFIVAANIEERVAYIVSADEILQDITARSGKECSRGQPLYGESSVRSSTTAEKWGGIAAVSQLLGQAITVIQKIQDARGKVHGASGRLDGYQSQLDSLLCTLRLVEDEPELQTLLIEKQAQKIIDIAKELQRLLNAFATQNKKNKTRQYAYALFTGNRDERELENAITQLDRAKADLTATIVTTHVGLSGSMRTGFTAALAIVQRVDRNVQKVLGERLSMAACLEGRYTDDEGNGTVPLTAEDIKALDLVDKASWLDSEAFNNSEAFKDADIFNTDLLERQVHTPTERLYQGTKAHGRSTVLQGNTDTASLLAILRAKRR